MSTRERLVDVASRLFAERGFDGVSVRDIARKANANLGAVTYHFGGKEDLFEEVLAQKTEMLREVGGQIMESDREPDDKLRAMLEAFAMHILHFDPSLKVMFAEMICGGAHMPGFMVESVEWRNKIFGDVVREGIRKGVFRECDVECAAWHFFGMLSAYILYQPLSAKGGRLKPYSKAYVKRIVNAAIDVFMNGLRNSRLRPEATARRG